MSDETLTIPVDPEPIEHGLLLFVLFLLTAIAGYVLIGAVLGIGACSPLSVVGGLGLAAGVLQLVERSLKSRWTSNRFVVIAEDTIHLLRKGQQRQEIEPEAQVNVLMWRFEVSRRTRVPKGWFVVSMALEQNDVYLPVYALMSPDMLNEKGLSAHFPALISKKQNEFQRDTDLRRAGLQQRLHTAEVARSVEGVEMTVDNFIDYIRALQSRFPDWMPEFNIL
jgi:hypothetical protein